MLDSRLSEMLAGVRPEVRLEPDEAGRAQVAVSFPAVRPDRDVSHLAQQVFALPGKIAEARRKRMAIALDEFQGIAAFNGGSVEHALRAAVQQQRQVGYVFSGSEPALMERMLGKSRPFYKAGPVMRLQKIPADCFAAFIEAKFKASGFKPAPGLGTAVVELAGNLPYDVQRLAHEVWDDVKAGGGRSATLEDLHDSRSGCSENTRHCSKAAGNGSRSRSGLPFAPPSSKMAWNSCRATCGRVTASAERRPCKHRSRRSCARTF